MVVVVSTNATAVVGGRTVTTTMMRFGDKLPTSFSWSVQDRLQRKTLRLMVVCTLVLRDFCGILGKPVEVGVVACCTPQGRNNAIEMIYTINVNKTII